MKITTLIYGLSSHLTPSYNWNRYNLRAKNKMTLNLKVRETWISNHFLISTIFIYSFNF